MISIRCPYCNELRTEEELAYGGEADVVRPLEPHGADSEQWTDYLFMRNNPKGPIQEQWCCAAGCGQWFKVQRDVVTHDVDAVARMADALMAERRTAA